MKAISHIVGENLKSRMKEVGHTQKSLADKLGLAQPNVSRWLSGEVMPDKATQEKLCKALNCPIERLIQTSDSSDISNILGSIDSRLKAIEEALMPRERGHEKSELQAFAETVKSRTQELGVSPFDVLMKEIAEAQSRPPQPRPHSTLNKKKTS